MVSIRNGSRQLVNTKEPFQNQGQDLTPAEPEAGYKELNEVDFGFAHLKGPLEVRRVHHLSEGTSAGACVPKSAPVLSIGYGSECQTYLRLRLSRKCPRKR